MLHKSRPTSSGPSPDFSIQNLPEQPLVSVVTPVHDGEEFLSECIESVLAQTYSNWEYTIVNNCSKDRTLEIAQRYAKEEARIRIVDNSEFLRMLSNHNLAMRSISPASKYCKVVFADDWLFPECLEKMVSLAEANPRVGIVGSYRLQGDAVTSVGVPYNVPVIAGREICRATLLRELYVFGTPSSLLIRSDLVRSRTPFYDESNLHADTEVCYEFLKECDFGFVHQVLTFTRTQDGSMTSFSRDRGTFFAGFLGYLIKYGPHYLKADELKLAVEAHLNSYYKILGRSVFRRKGKEFWKFHELKLKELGYPLNRVRVAREAMRRAADVALALNWWPYLLLKRTLRAFGLGRREA
jgi:glycosyltransferase involved in cell wall biosynthesis